MPGKTTTFDYAFPMLELDWKVSPKTGALVIALFLLGLAIASGTVPVTSVTTHNILHHLNFLPLMMAGMLFGMRGASRAALLAALVNAPVVALEWPLWQMDAEDQLLELAIFAAAGLIAGLLSDRERAHRNMLETTRKELEKVYLELQASIAEMKKAERLSAAGQLAASLAHEIRNPLASISGAAGILQRDTAPREFIDDSLEIIQKESQRLNTLLSGFLNFARPRSLRLQPTCLEELVSSVIALANHAAQKRDIQFVLEQRPHEEHKPEEHESLCDPEQLKQVLLNLVINAIEASPEHATIRLSITDDHDGTSMDVEDAGCGIPDEVAEHIFEPFFTTRASGTGLGLAISSMIVGQHGGTLSFYRNHQGGTTFRILLPHRKTSPIEELPRVG